VQGRIWLTNNDRWFFVQLYLVSIDPAGAYGYPSGDAPALASGRLSLLLALEVALTGRAAADRGGPPGVDPAVSVENPRQVLRCNRPSPIEGHGNP
jgi:hypothetical protein